MKGTKRTNNRPVITALHEWESIKFSRKPRSMMLIFICVFNLFLLLISAWIISAFAIPGNERMGFFTASYNTLTMILDAGCIESIIQNPGQTNLFLILFCLVVIVISMITFTGALIGYVSNVISNLIENANTNSQVLKISNHYVILGWNSRASEMVNDLLYCPTKQRVVVLSDRDATEITREVEERLKDTIQRENQALMTSLWSLSWLKRIKEYRNLRLTNNITFIARVGDVFSTVQLNNIQIKKARSIIVLSSRNRCIQEGTSLSEWKAEQEKGDSRTIKTLMQVIDLTSSSGSNDDQKIVVEIDNDWTKELINRIIQTKQEIGKCRVVPFEVNNVMGRLLGQFSLMPELNLVYRELFSNKGTEFFSLEQKRDVNPVDYIGNYLENHQNAIPLTFMKDSVTGKDYCYYMAMNETDIRIEEPPTEKTCKMSLNTAYWINEKYVLILGSNSKIKNIMNSFEEFSAEWTEEHGHSQIVHVTIVDEEEKLEEADYYRSYCFVEKCVAARIYDQKEITITIKDFINRHPHHSSILILSDDQVKDEDVDSNALTYLIYTKDLINKARAHKRDESFDIDIVVEILDPKHYDVIKSYDVSNVVISNRYISKMVTQISENYALYSFFTDLLNYDTKDSSDVQGKEIYIKTAGEYFDELPPKNTPVSAIIRETYRKSRGFWGSNEDFAVLLGVVDSKGNMTLFSGPQDRQTVSLKKDDNLVMFSNH